MTRSRRNFSRRVNRRQTKQRFLIVCQGEKTEKFYFKSFRLTSAQIKVETQPISPEQLVNKAFQLSKDDENGFDQVWCVFDKDEFLDENIRKAFSMASKKRIKIAFSNPCFELWFLLHFVICDYSIERNVLIEEKLISFLPNYLKNDKEIYLKILAEQPKAIERADKLSSPQNPSTTVHNLVKELNKFLP